MPIPTSGFLTRKRNSPTSQSLLVREPLEDLSHFDYILCIQAACIYHLTIVHVGQCVCEVEYLWYGQTTTDTHFSENNSSKPGKHPQPGCGRAPGLE